VKITANEARLRLAAIEIKFLQGTIRKQREWQNSTTYVFGGNIVGDHDEDYVVDALFYIPNR
jgi:hypothetical protein